jgi:hypothetical protein
VRSFRKLRYPDKSWRQAITDRKDWKSLHGTGDLFFSESRGEWTIQQECNDLQQRQTSTNNDKNQLPHEEEQLQWIANRPNGSRFRIFCRASDVFCESWLKVSMIRGRGFSRTQPIPSFGHIDNAALNEPKKQSINHCSLAR